MIRQTVYCDIKGCGKEITTNIGGGLVFQAPSSTRVVHLCRQHWDDVVKNLLPMFEGGDNEDVQEVLNVSRRDGSGDADNENIVQFKENPTDRGKPNTTS